MQNYIKFCNNKVIYNNEKSVVVGCGLTARNETDKSKVSLEGRGMKQGEDLSKQNITSFEDATEGRDVNTLT